MPDDTVYFGFVVEGDGEVEAAPLLVRRIAHELCHFYNLATTQPVRVSRSKIVRPGEIERAVRLARLNNRAAGPVMIIFDSDDDCPAQLSPILRCHLDAVLPLDSLSVVVAKPEFETWFLASLASLADSRGLRPNLTSPTDPESIRGAKEFLNRSMTAGRKYSPTIDQAALVGRMDLMQAARKSQSFNRLCREVGRLIGRIPAGL